MTLWFILLAYMSVVLKSEKNPSVKFVSVHLYFDVELVLLKHGFLVLSWFHFMSISLSHVQAWKLFYHDVLLIWTFWFYYYTIIVTDLFSLSIIKKKKSIISFYHFGKKTPMDSIKMAPVCKNTFTSSTFFHVVWWIWSTMTFFFWTSAWFLCLKYI